MDSYTWFIADKFFLSFYYVWNGNEWVPQFRGDREVNYDYETILDKFIEEYVA